jgi:hypothetical protein
MAYSERLKTVLSAPGGILDGVSGGKAQLRVARLGETIAPATVIAMKKGLFGEDLDAVRKIGRAYAPEIVARHGEELQELFGEAGEPQAPDWLAYVASGHKPYAHPLDTESRVAEASALYQVAELAAEKAARLLVDEMRSSPHPAALFWDEVRQLNEETGAGIQVYLHEGSAGLTAERVRGYVQAIRNTLKEEGMLPQKGEP